MKRIKYSAVILFLLYCIASANCLAMEKDSGVIKGRIVNSLTQEPLPSAELSLMNKTDASIRKSAVPQRDGMFEFNDVPFGKYTLTVSCEGYLKGVVEDIELSPEAQRLDLKKLALRENVVMLDEVTVVAGKLKGDERIDRTVFTINDDIRNISASGLDLLRHIPSVTVDLMENVALEGRSDIQFYVDGVRRSKEFVAQLDPEKVDRVEVITNPSVKYDGDVSGIISIVLKDHRRSGVGGSVTAALPHPDKVVADPSANLEVGYGNFRFFVGDQVHYQKFDNTETTSGRWNDVSGNDIRFEKLSAGQLKSEYNHLSYGVDWFADEKTSLNFLGEWKSWQHTPGNETSRTRTYLGDALAEYYETDSDSRPHEDNHYLSLYFLRELAQEGCEFDAELFFHQQSGGADTTYTDTFYDTEDPETMVNTVRRYERVDDTSRTAQLKAGYAFLFKDVKNEIGLKSSAGWTDSESRQEDQWSVASEVFGETFGYEEFCQRLYYNLLGKTGKISWQLGLSGEYDRIEIDGGDTLEDLFFLPQLSLQREFETAGSLKLSFSRQINRPDVHERHPYETASDSLHIQTGNPNLDPEVENELELAYSRNFEDNFISPKLYFRYTGNVIQDVTTVREGGVSVTTRDNVGKHLEYGIGINTALQLTERLRLSGNASVYRREIKTTSVSEDDSKKHNVGFRFNATTIYSFPREYSLFLTSWYRSPKLTYQRETSRDLLALLGLGKKFSEKAEFNVLYAPVIDDYTYSKSIVDYAGYHEETAGSVDVRNLFFVEFTYRFKSGKDIKKIERSVEYDSDEGGGAL